MLLIDVYAKPSACVAVDELDSGIFEFLLGELLQVLKEHGRGQLILPRIIFVHWKFWTKVRFISRRRIQIIDTSNSAEAEKK